MLRASARVSCTDGTRCRTRHTPRSTAVVRAAPARVARAWGCRSAAGWTSASPRGRAARAPPHRPSRAKGQLRVYASSVASSDDLAEFIAVGPLLPKLGLKAAAVAEQLAWWTELGDVLCGTLGMDPSNLNAAERGRVFHYYLPVFYWFEQTLAKHRESTAKPLVVGISAPQGCGKTTLVTALETLFAHRNVTCGTVSIDDFYLTFADQTALAEANPDNSLLQYRGNACSHDMALGTATLRALAEADQAGVKVAAPRYDKSANGGRGDRADAATWPTIEGPVQVVLFEGWMLGFSPVSSEAAAAVSPELVPVNEKLREYEQAWDSYCAAWLVIQVQDYNWVQKWRLQAEVAMRDRGLPAMTDEQVRDFVNRFLPAYQAYLPGLYSNGPTTATADTPLLEIVVDADRNVQR